ncbi:MAG: hypothetical protein IPO41_02805 [Acidobacteria bacterium]|nr:hypothetical protein [Acidobacteriota bacterium]MBK9527254.1 hypothetical protein [Acidobacteriota bacterium]MBP7476114.1 hypothetical protein [Pyrinomonadaceae bacterium]MBP9108243.1 hypothetical protein [Pyrinomonadaceae bacterium]
MKKTKNIVAIFAMSALAAICGFAQTPEKPANPNYDAALAAKAGGDDSGMRSYVFCILKTGPKDASITDKKQRDEIFAGHMANIGRLAGEGKLALAGPFGKNDRQYRGIFILAVTTVEEAQKLVDTDPVIKSGMMIAELTPWYGSAATMLVNENHKKIAEKGQ